MVGMEIGLNASGNLMPRLFFVLKYIVVRMVLRMGWLA
jgi:hypothetical protein